MLNNIKAKMEEAQKKLSDSFLESQQKIEQGVNNIKREVRELGEKAKHTFSG